MRSDHLLDETVPDFTLTCAGYRPGKRGASKPPLSFRIGGEVFAEISHADLLESWKAASELSPKETTRMAQVAASHLTSILDSGIGAADLTDAVTDAAVVLLLAMRRQGIADAKRIPACTVMWNGQEGRERVLLSA